MRAVLQIACVLALVASVLPASAQTPPPDARSTREGDYRVTRWQVKQGPSADSVGYITTDYEVREGIVDTDAYGNSRTSTIKVGGFVKRCPTADGKAHGTFEYSLKVEEVDTDHGETQRPAFTRGFRATSMVGEVQDDATLKRVDVEGMLSKGDGSQPVPVPRMSFTPDRSGQPDWDAMRRAVELTGDLSLATVIWFAAPNFRDAEASWKDKNHPCVKFQFDPPTETVMLAPNESKAVRVELRTIREPTPVTPATITADRLPSHGSLAPRTDRTLVPMPTTLTYTASATPERGHGFKIFAISRAGVAWDDKWQIDEGAKFEGTLTQKQQMTVTPPQFAGYGVAVTMDYKTDARLVWTPEPASTRAPTFGEVASKFYVPTDGQITVKVDSVEGKSIAGSCVYEGSKTFPIRSLPPAALNHLALEVAADGRYRLTLRMMSGHLLFQATRNCRFRAAPGFPLPVGGGGGTEIMDAAEIALGKPGGTLVDETIVGQTAAPIVWGGYSFTGEWQFKKSPPANR